MIEPKSSIKNIKPDIENQNETGWRLKLDNNENIYGASKFAISALRNFVSEEASCYANNSSYISKWAEIYNLKSNCILFTNGINSALNLIFNAYLDKDDIFCCYDLVDDKLIIYAKSTGAQVRFLEYGDDLEFNIDKIKESLISNTKLCYISTPNNITGQTIRASGIKKLLEEFPNTLFVVDVSYVNFAQNIDFKDYTDLVDNYSNIIIIKSYSNDYALAGLSFAVIVSNKEIINNLKILSYDNINTITLKSVISAINDTKYLEEIKKENIEARELLFNGLLDLGYKPYKSDTNFILCDFGEHAEFCYNKLKNNGVIVKKFKQDSIIPNCFRITVPKTGGVKFILNLLKPKDLIIFALEDTLLDVKKSYTEALISTFETYAKYRITFDKIKEIKHTTNCTNFKAIQQLLYDIYIEISLDDISRTFKDIFYNPIINKDNYLIDNDELLIDKEFFDKLSLNYDMAVVTDRLKEEAYYALNKFGIEKYFSYVKPNSSEISDIIKKCPHKKLLLIVSREDIMAYAKKAGIESIGLIRDKNDSKTINGFKHIGADSIIFENKDILSIFKLDI